MTFVDISLDFELILDEETEDPIPCESGWEITRGLKFHDAKWTTLWSCGCTRYGCDAALRRWRVDSLQFVCDTCDDNTKLVSWTELL